MEIFTAMRPVIYVRPVFERTLPGFFVRIMKKLGKLMFLCNASYILCFLFLNILAPILCEKSSRLHHFFFLCSVKNT